MLGLHAKFGRGLLKTGQFQGTKNRQTDSALYIRLLNLIINLKCNVSEQLCSCIPELNFFLIRCCMHNCVLYSDSLST